MSKVTLTATLPRPAMARGTIVFDVDGILAEQVYDGTNRSNAIHSIPSDGWVYHVRAGVRRFVKKVAKYADIAVWTANELEIVQPVLDYVFEGLELAYVRTENDQKLLTGRPTVIIDDEYDMVRMNPHNRYFLWTDTNANVPFDAYLHKELKALLRSQVVEYPITVYTDGSSLGNHLPENKRIGGIGIYIPDAPWSPDKVEHSYAYDGSLSKVTNNIMELRAATVALRAIARRALPPSTITLCTDSTYVLTGSKKRKGHKTNVEYWKQYLAVRNWLTKAGWAVELYKVKGHSGYEDGNAVADRLATTASEGLRDELA